MADKKDDIVLSIRGMSKSFGRNRVLDHINLELKRGTVMGLMGENGAGKSTMRMFCSVPIRKMREIFSLKVRKLIFPVRRTLWKMVLRWFIRN